MLDISFPICGSPFCFLPSCVSCIWKMKIIMQLHSVVVKSTWVNIFKVLRTVSCTGKCSTNANYLFYSGVFCRKMNFKFQCKLTYQSIPLVFVLSCLRNPTLHIQFYVSIKQYTAQSILFIYYFWMLRKNTFN